MGTMSLTLTIENHASLPDGGPLSFSVTGKRGFDFGRDQYLDWSLPDPTRYISGKHCEVRYQNGEYLLYDVSTNGTFLNGSQSRMQSPHRLRTGDMLTIGDYIIAVTVASDGGADAGPAFQPGGGARELWGADGDIAPPIDPKSLRAPGASRPVHADFLEQSMGSPELYDMRSPRRSAPTALPESAAPGNDPDFDWAPPAPRPAPYVEPPPASPAPRRAAAPVSDSPWGDDAPAIAAPPVAKLPEVSANPFIAAKPVSAPVAPMLEPVAEQQPAMPPPLEPAPVFAPAASRADADAFIARFAAGAGVPAANFAGQDPLVVAQMAGEIVRAVVVDMMQLLGARNEARRMARSSNQTVIQALDNNPLKFSPTPEDALRVMLGPQTKSYLDARRALAQGFRDLKTHQVKTYSAMQAAMRMIAEELDPEALEKSLPAAGGLAEMIGSRKARLWEAYAARWKAKTERHDDGLVDVFMLYFADCYDRGADGQN